MEITMTIILVIGIIFSLGSFSYEIWKRMRIVFKGTGSLPFDRPLERSWRFFKEVMLQEKVIKGRPLAGIMHIFIGLKIR